MEVRTSGESDESSDDSDTALYDNIVINIV
jgi:hypothetical protein